MKFPEKYQIAKADDGAAYAIPLKSETIFVIASNGLGWDHVSVSLKHRIPTWEEMCYVKDFFFDEEECVMQLHPPKSEYVNYHEFCLHLWKPQHEIIPRPSSILIGPK